MDRTASGAVMVHVEPQVRPGRRGAVSAGQGKLTASGWPVDHLHDWFLSGQRRDVCKHAQHHQIDGEVSRGEAADPECHAAQHFHDSSALE